MEKMPYRSEIERAAEMSAPETAGTGWRAGLPSLTGSNFTLRELCIEDAPALLAMVATEDVSRFISPPPSTIEGFERFITWTQEQRAAGRYFCFGIVPEGATAAVGLFQVRGLDLGLGCCEWGFAMGSQFWGTGLFVDAAHLVLDFVVDVVRVQRLEARAAVANGRGNGALRKLGAVQEGVLRRSFLRHGHYHDQLLWSILADDWRMQRAGQHRVLH